METQTKDDAKMAAVYIKELVANGIDTATASSLTVAYVGAVISMRFASASGAFNNLGKK